MNNFKEKLNDILDHVKDVGAIQNNRKDFVLFAEHHFKMLNKFLKESQSAVLNEGEFDFFERNALPILYRVYKQLLEIKRFKIKVATKPEVYDEGKNVTMWSHKIFTILKYNQGDLMAFNQIDADCEYVAMLAEKIVAGIDHCIHPDKRGTLYIYEIWPQDYWGKEWLFWCRIAFVEDVDVVYKSRSLGPSTIGYHTK